MNRHVILFLPSYESGGVERNATYFANGMVDRGYRMHLMYCRKIDAWFSQLDPRVERVKITRLLNLPLVHERILDALSMFLFSPLKILQIRGTGPTVVVAFQSNAVAILLARLCRVGVVVRLSNHFEVISHEKSILRKLSEASKKISYRYADVVIANSKELARDYAAYLGLPVNTIQNPVDFEKIKQLMKEQPEEELFSKRSTGRQIVISAGRLTAQKNFPLLIRAMVEVRKVVPCDLVILGDGSKKKSLEKLVSNLGLSKHVHFLGYKKNIYQYFARSDVFVLSSNYEGMPNVLIEAIACGLPAVATRCKSGPTEILCDGAGGELVPVNNIKAMGVAIIKTLRETKLANQKLAVATANLVSYDRATIEQKYDDTLNACLAVNSRARAKSKI